MDNIPSQEELRSQFENLKFKNQVLDYLERLHSLTFTELEESLASCQATLALFSALELCLKSEIKKRNIEKAVEEVE